MYLVLRVSHCVGDSLEVVADGDSEVVGGVAFELLARARVGSRHAASKSGIAKSAVVVLHADLQKYNINKHKQQTNTTQTHDTTMMNMTDNK